MKKALQLQLKINRQFVIFRFGNFDTLELALTYRDLCKTKNCYIEFATFTPTAFRRGRRWKPSEISLNSV